MYWPPLDGTVLLVLDEPTIGMPNISKTELCDILSSGSGSGSWLFPRKGSPPQSLDTPYTMLILSNHPFDTVFTKIGMKTQNEIDQDLVELQALKTRFTVVDLHSTRDKLNFQIIREHNPTYKPDPRRKILQPPSQFLHVEDCVVIDRVKQDLISDRSSLSSLTSQELDEVLTSGSIVRQNAFLEPCTVPALHEHPLQRSYEAPFAAVDLWFCTSCDKTEKSTTLKFTCYQCRQLGLPRNYCSACYFQALYKN